MSVRDVSQEKLFLTQKLEKSNSEFEQFYKKVDKFMAIFSTKILTDFEFFSYPSLTIHLIRLIHQVQRKQLQEAV